MGNPLFGVDISGIIRDNVGPGVLAATLTKSTNGTRTAGQLTGGTQPTTATYTCRGFIDRQARRTLDGSLIDNDYVQIVLIGDSIASAAVPEQGDRITIEGATYIVAVIDRDPAAATYTCSCNVQ